MTVAVVVVVVVVVPSRRNATTALHYAAQLSNLEAIQKCGCHQRPDRWKVGQQGYPPRKPLLIRIYLQDSLFIYCIYIYIEIHLQTYLYILYYVWCIWLRILVYIDSDPCPYFLCHVRFSSEMLWTILGRSYVCCYVWVLCWRSNC